MLNRTLVAGLVAATAGLADGASAQNYETITPATPNAGESRQIVAERVVSQNPMVIERQVVIAKIMRMPERNTGVSRVGGTVGGAIGGYYINGTTPAENLPLDIPPEIYNSR
jgi:hypothetical protein